MTLEQAQAWPDLLSIVRDKVKPERDKNNRDVYRVNWWQFGEKRPALYDALLQRKRCLVNSQVSKHLVFAWQPTNRLFAHTLYVYPFEENSRFAVLQSRVHEFWARTLASSMRNDLRYSSVDCFENFPFPPLSAELEAIGEKLYTTRAQHMRDTKQGLTLTYNQLKDPRCVDPRILALRQLHEDLDRTVVAAYGWSNLEVPLYCPQTPEEENRLEAFSSEVIDRLFDLNEKVAKQELLLGRTKQLQETIALPSSKAFALTPDSPPKKSKKPPKQK